MNKAHQAVARTALDNIKKRITAMDISKMDNRRLSILCDVSRKLRFLVRKADGGWEDVPVAVQVYSGMGASEEPCPACGKMMIIDDEAIGGEGGCYHCGQPLIITNGR